MPATEHEGIGGLSSGSKDEEHVQTSQFVV